MDHFLSTPSHQFLLLFSFSIPTIGAMMALKYDLWKTNPITSTTSTTIFALSHLGHTPSFGTIPTNLRARASERDRLLSLSSNGFDGERERRVADSLRRLKVQCFNMTLYREENYDLKVLLAPTHIIIHKYYHPLLATYGLFDISYLLLIVIESSAAIPFTVSFLTFFLPEDLILFLIS